MDKFLENVVDELLNSEIDFSNHVCIVPGKRIALFMKEHLHKRTVSPAFLPEFYTITDFVKETTELELLDNFELSIELFKVYNKVAKESIEFIDFLAFGSQIISDFNEIELYKINTDDLFAYVSDVRAIEVWNIDGSEITPFQRRYLDFWNTLGELYKKFKDDLISNGKATSSIALRSLDDDFLNCFKRLKGKTFSVIGLNAISPVEESIFKKLSSYFDVKFFWDSDQFYLQNTAQEAGHFIRKWNKIFDSWENNFDSRQKAKEINICPSAQNIFQVKSVASVIDKLDPQEYRDTAILLADEDLLIPLLGALPCEKISPNISMGYSLRNTSVFSFIEVFLSLKIRQIKQGGDVVYHKDLIRFIDHEFMSKILGDKNVCLLKDYILKGNKVYISVSWIKENLFPNDNDLQIVFESDHWLDFRIEKLTRLVNLLKNRLDYLKANWESEQLYLTYQKLQSYTELFSQNTFLNDIYVFKKLFKQFLSKEKIDLMGEPLRGIQIMGLLESRGLDFKNVFITSMNEGSMPKVDKSKSFIPHDIKVQFGLPTWKERDSIYAYYFYRAIQRAKNVYLCYSEHGEETGGGEKSRFISQIEFEWKKTHPEANFNLKTEASFVDTREPKKLLVNSSDIIKSELLKRADKGFSPTSLNKYFQCELDFYYRYVLGLYELEEVEESISFSTFGTIVHAVLEEMFEPFIGKQLKVEDIDKMNVLVHSILIKKYKEEYKEGDFSSGKNYLSFKVAKKNIERFLEAQKREIDKSGNDLTIVSLEENYSYDLVIDEGIRIKLIGNIDRVDNLNGIRILDYKSGKVEAKDLRINTDKKQFGDYPKAFQLMYYAFLYYKNTGIVPSDIGNISFRNMKEWILPLTVNGEKNISIQLMNEFEDYLKLVFKEILSKNKVFIHNEKAEYCQFC